MPIAFLIFNELYKSQRVTVFETSIHLTELLVAYNQNHESFRWAVKFAFGRNVTRNTVKKWCRFINKYIPFFILVFSELHLFSSKYTKSEGWPLYTVVQFISIVCCFVVLFNDVYLHEQCANAECHVEVFYISITILL